MFPLTQRKLIRGCFEHKRSGLGCAADYKANRDNLYLPFTGKVEVYSGYEGGNWLRVTRDNGDKIEFAHLHNYIVKNGKFKEGTLVAITGNTGHITTGPHLHVQILDKDGNRLDPELYLWDDSIETLFKEVWKREGAKGEIMYFRKRLQKGTIKDMKDMKVKMEYWHGIVYPNGKYSLTGDARWQYEKFKVITYG